MVFSVGLRFLVERVLMPGVHFTLAGVLGLDFLGVSPLLSASCRDEVPIPGVGFPFGLMPLAFSRRS